MNAVVVGLLVGLAAGILSGLLGIGGGIIMIPALVFILGYSQHSAQGTTLAAMVLPIGFLAAYQYYKSGYVDIKVALAIAAAFFIGGFFGAKFAVNLNTAVLKKLFAVLMLFIAVRMLISK